MIKTAASNSPLINEDLQGQAAACVYFREPVWQHWVGSTTVSPVHIFPSPSELLVCYHQHRQTAMPGQKSIYETFLGGKEGGVGRTSMYGMGKDKKILASLELFLE
jgi:hypothetical protein